MSPVPPRRLATLVGALLLVATVTAADAASRPGAPTPEREPVLWMIITGSIAAGSGWGAALVASFAYWAVGDEIGCSSCKSVAEVLWIPFVGPALAHARGSTNSAGNITITASLTLLQAGGAALMVAGYVGQRRKPTASWQVTPLVGAVNGLGISARW